MCTGVVGRVCVVVVGGGVVGGVGVDCSEVIVVCGAVVDGCDDRGAVGGVVGSGVAGDGGNVVVALGSLSVPASP